MTNQTKTQKVNSFSNEILPKLKIYGYSKIEDFILSALVTGDPLLLIGSHGTAKTMLVRALARSLGLNFIAYDASKALFEDVIGFPNPTSLSNGQVEYVPTEISIWDKEFILIDEISRASPDMQNKWLEIIRSRQVMGKKVPNLKYIFAAMNPSQGEYLGTTSLDKAFVGRFAFIITVPDVSQMDSDDVIKIINNVSEDDAVNIKTLHLNNNVVSDELPLLISSAQEILPEIEQSYGQQVTTYVYNVASNFLTQNIFLDGRRLGMIKRNIIAYLAIKTLKYKEKYVKENFNNLLFECLSVSLPFPATGETVREDQIRFVHIKSCIKDSPKKSSAKPSSYFTNKYLSIAYYITENHDNLTLFDKNKYLSTLLEMCDFENLSTPEDIVDAYIAIKHLVQFCQQNSSKIFVEFQSKVYAKYISFIHLFHRTEHLEFELNYIFDLCPKHLISDRFYDIATRLTKHIAKKKGIFKRGFNLLEKFYDIKNLLITKEAVYKNKFGL